MKTVQERIAAIKRIKHDAGLLREVADQVKAQAARLETEADSALLAFGSDSRAGRKARKPGLNAELAIKLQGGLTKMGKRKLA
jgi:hypothetical protein